MQNTYTQDQEQSILQILDKFYTKKSAYLPNG